MIIPIDELIPDPDNARDHNDRNRKAIETSVATFGAGRSIMVDGDGIVRAGNGTIEAAKKAGIDSVMVIETDGKTLVAVKRPDLKGDRAIAAGLADNASGDLAGWKSGVRELVERVSLDGFSFDDIGLGQKDIDGMVGRVQPTVDQDEIPEPPKAPVTKMGDVWTMGRHRVSCGDFRDTRISTEKQNTFGFTSPPYNAGNNALGGNKNMVASKYKNDADRKPASEYLEFLRSMSEWMIGSSLCFMINIQPLAGNKIPMHQWIGLYAEYLIDRIVWFKGHGQPQQAARVVNSRFEDLLVFSSTKNPTRSMPFATFHGTVSNVYEGRGASGENVTKTTHAATMPTHLALWAIGVIADRASLIIDPFLGSGTTMIAAEQLDRACHGVEIDPAYVDVIVERWQNLTGGKATRKTS